MKQLVVRLRNSELKLCRGACFLPVSCWPLLYLPRDCAAAVSADLPAVAVFLSGKRPHVASLKARRGRNGTVTEDAASGPSDSVPEAFFAAGCATLLRARLLFGSSPLSRPRRERVASGSPDAAAERGGRGCSARSAYCTYSDGQKAGGRNERGSTIFRSLVALRRPVRGSAVAPTAA